MNHIDQTIEAIVGPIANVLDAIVFAEIPIFGGIPLIVIWLMAAAVFLTVWLKFQPITGARHSLGVITGKFTRKTDPGDISSSKRWPRSCRAPSASATSPASRWRCPWAGLAQRCGSPLSGCWA